jgi:hypothetical protein
MPTLCFSPLVLSTGHVMLSSASGAQNITALLFIFGWDRFIFNKKRFGTCYAELVFLHAVGVAAHVVHSGAFGA